MLIWVIWHKLFEIKRIWESGLVFDYAGTRKQSQFQRQKTESRSQETEEKMQNKANLFVLRDAWRVLREEIWKNKANLFVLRDEYWVREFEKTKPIYKILVKSEYY